MRDYVDMRFTALQLAVDKAEAQMRDRLAGMNEFRDALKDQAGRLATRESVEWVADSQRAQTEKLWLRIEALERKQSHAEGRSWMFFTLLGLGLTVLSIALRFLIP